MVSTGSTARRQLSSRSGRRRGRRCCSPARSDRPRTPQARKGRKRVYVLVVDGCKPGEITAARTPNLALLRDHGTNFPRARSMPIMETIPNHVMMMTGVRPDRSGVPANSVYDRDEKTVRDLDRATDLHFPTVIERLNRHGYTTGTVLSKEYLYGVFGTRATHRWEPQPIVPVSGHAPDQFTMDAALAMVDQFDPNLVFVNLGDCDRVGHSDLSGTTLQAARQTALTTVDYQVGRFVDMLKSSGRWKNSVVIVLADHSMDWSLPDALVSLAPGFDADPLLAGNVQIADNGGADLLYWTGPADRRAEAVQRMRTIAEGDRGRAVGARPGGAPARRACRRPGRLLQGRLALQRPRPVVEPDPRQPRPPGHAADPVLPHRRLTARARTASRVRRPPTPSTWRRPSARCSASASPAAATTASPASDATAGVAGQQAGCSRGGQRAA